MSEMPAAYDFGHGSRGAALRHLGQCIDPQTGAVDNLGEAALVLAGLDHPDAEIDTGAPLLAEIEAAVRDACGQAAEGERAAQLGPVLARRYDFAGDRDSYDDMQNADLIRVLQRRRGLPVALGIIYMHCARSAGLAAHGIAFPSHFLIRVEDGATQSLLDPFDAGKILQAPELRAVLKRHFGADAELQPEHYATVSDRDVLLRLQNNILTRAVEAEDLARAKDILERMIALMPDNAGLYREIGAITLRQGDRLGALKLFQMFFERAPDGVTRSKAAALVQRLQSLLQDDDRRH